MYIRLYKIRPKTTSNFTTRNGRLTTLTPPYLKGPSEAIRRVLQPLNIRIFFRLTRTLMCHPKDPVPAHQQAGIVYKIPCSDCSSHTLNRQEELLHNV